MKIIKNFTKNLLVISVLFITSSCAKDLAQHENIPPTINRVKFQKIERFISITWKTAPERVIFNADKQEFTFGENGELKLSKAEAERLYDNANNYKAQYEK